MSLVSTQSTLLPVSHSSLMQWFEDLNLLAVSRAHHRQGLGGLLLREPLMRADARGAKTYIEASPAGLPLYLRLGWEPVDEIVLDLDRHNVARGSGKHTEKCLMRSPR